MPETSAMVLTPSKLLPKPLSPEHQPIINSPFYPPQYHWPLNSETKAFAPASNGRRSAQNMPPVAGSRSNRQDRQRLHDIGIAWDELRLVNQIRQAVADWQTTGYPAATATTRDLINHWTDREEFPLYFAQIDAVLTHIYLREIRPPDINQELEKINLKYNDGIERIAHKMATATGKTPVMAMLILWQAANHYTSGQQDSRFVRRFLLITPGITVRERLQNSLDPRQPNNDWKTFNLIPPGDLYEQALASASVKIVNYHQLEPQTTGLKPSNIAQQLINGGSRPTTPEELATRIETPSEIVERIADGKTQKGNILVINDEGHHCHRGNPDKKGQSDTQWFTSIRHIRDTRLLSYVTDMSATPIFLTQSTPRPFEWIISDYSLVDAIEAGLTKIPRVPTRTTTEKNSRFRDIFSNTDRKQASDFRPEDAGNNTLLKEALEVLYRDYETKNDEWQNRNEVPVMAIVMNSVKNANAMYKHISSGTATPLFSNYTDAIQTELRNDPHTIIVHSKMEDGEAATGETGRQIREIAAAYRRNPNYGFTDDDKSEYIIRRVMNTVGRHRQPGEHVRCVISVNMLTEGWNTKTVTHLLGFRKFGSSLLCEQVAGRTLRRVTNDFQDEQDLLFKPEYAQIFGIPFPQYEEPEEEGPVPKPSLPPVLMEPLESQRKFRIEWPNIVKLQRPGSHQAIQVRTKPGGPDETHTVIDVLPETAISEGITGPHVEMTSDAHETKGTFLYRAAREVVRTIEKETEQQALTEQPGQPVIQVAKLFGQTVKAAQQYHGSGYIEGPENQDRWPTDETTILKASQWLHRNLDIIKPETGTIWLQAIPSAISHWQHTGELREYDTGNNPKRIYGPTKKSEISYAHCDSEWEWWVAKQLDEMDEILRWTRNKGLNWSIPYVADRQQRSYWPDFVAVVQLNENQELHMVIEVKGLERDNDPIKRRWAQEYWVPAVNHHQEYGLAAGRTWAYLYLDDEALVINATSRIQELIDQYRQAQIA